MRSWCRRACRRRWTSMKRLKNRHTTARLAWEPRLHDPFLPKWLHRIDVPVKIIWGKQDRILPVGILDEMKRLMPKAKTLVLDNCGHLPHAEKVEEFVDFVCASSSSVPPHAIRRPRPRGRAQERHGVGEAAEQALRPREGAQALQPLPRRARVWRAARLRCGFGERAPPDRLWPDAFADRDCLGIGQTYQKSTNCNTRERAAACAAIRSPSPKSTR